MKEENILYGLVFGIGLDLGYPFARKDKGVFISTYPIIHQHSNALPQNIIC